MKKIFSILLLLIVVSTAVQSQAFRRVIFEKWTSSTCPPCASQNPYWHSWSQQYFDSITTVAYHVGWPAPGNDPMYLHNPTQSYDRRYYYGINSVPCARVDGLFATGGCVGCSYSNQTGCLTSYFDQRRGVATPVAIWVTDTRIPGDSIKANIIVTNLSNLPSGSYSLRVMAIEKMISYSSPPGTNGETQFPDVFRRSYPNSQGTSLPTTAGTYNFEFRYKVDPVWVDSMMYTLAFVQEDNSKEIFNSANPFGVLTGIQEYNNQVPAKVELKQNYPNPFNPSTYISFNLPKDQNVTLKVYDAVGNEIKTLVSGEQKAGAYNIYFDGYEYASGVYFYTLTTPDFSETKKMLLIK